MAIAIPQDPGLAPLAQLAFAAAKEEARALLCAAHTARAGLSGQQLPAGAPGVGGKPWVTGVATNQNGGLTMFDPQFLVFFW